MKVFVDTGLRTLEYKEIQELTAEQRAALIDRYSTLYQHHRRQADILAKRELSGANVYLKLLSELVPDFKPPEDKPG